MGVQLVGRLRFQDRAEPLHADRSTTAVEGYAPQPDTRVVAGGDQVGEQVERAVAPTGDSRVEHAAGLVRVGEIGFHHDPQALHLCLGLVR